MIKRDLETRFKKDPKYSKHVREDVPPPMSTTPRASCVFTTWT
jgi:hypothetical protein